MKHLLSILIFFSFMSVASADVCSYVKLSNKASNYSEDQCVGENLHWHSGGFCMHAYLESCDGVDLREQKFVPIEEQVSNRTPTQIQNNTILIVSLIFGILIIYLLVSASVKKTKEVYKSSTIPLKNKVKRKELETRFNELDEVKPAEHTYKKTAYVDDTEEINEVKKLERQIKIKKLQKELKDLEEE